MTYKFKIFISWFTIVLLLSSCAGLQFKYATLNHAGHVDGIYNSTGNIKIDTLSYSQFKWKIQNNFQFRYDYAQYALSQPLSFDWNNRLLGFRYNRFNRWGSYYGYNYYWNRTQMWNDWVWGYPYFSPHRWSPFGYDRWGYNSYGWNNYGWNSWGWNGYQGNNWGWRYQMNNYAWNNRYRRNTVYVNGHRTSNRTSTRTVVNNTNRRTTPSVNTNNNNRTIRVNKPRINNPRPTINNNSRPRINNTPRPTQTIRTTPRTSTRSTNNTTVRSNSRRKN